MTLEETLKAKAKEIGSNNELLDHIAQLNRLKADARELADSITPELIKAGLLKEALTANNAGARVVAWTKLGMTKEGGRLHDPAGSITDRRRDPQLIINMLSAALPPEALAAITQRLPFLALPAQSKVDPPPAE